MSIYRDKNRHQPYTYSRLCYQDPRKCAGPEESSTESGVPSTESAAGVIEW